MSKKNILFLLFISFYTCCNVNLWDVKTVYHIKNDTKEAMHISWQSGGGQANVLTGRKGALVLGPLESKTIETVNRDCLDNITVTSDVTSQTTSLVNVCKLQIAIGYQGDLKGKKLTLFVE